MSLSESSMLAWHKQQHHIAQGCLTNSRHPKTYVYGEYPLIINRASGCQIWTDRQVHGSNRAAYIDFVCGLGTNLFGYDNSIVETAYSNARYYGTSPTFATPWETQLGEKLSEIFPFAQKWKFVNDGSSSCQAACLIAKAYTNRPVVAVHGYHGWHPSFTSLSPPSLGCQGDFLYRKLSDISSDTGTETAAVIVEPVITKYDKSQVDWLYQLREECTKKGILLIYDEIITGMRFRGHSVAADTGIYPDIICIGKSLANGHKIAAVGGSALVMDSPYFVSGTYHPNPQELAAAYTCCDLLQRNPRYKIENLWHEGQRFIDRFNAINSSLQIEGYPTRGILKGDDNVKALFMQEACRAGYIFGHSWFFNWDHIAFAEEVLHGCRDILGRIERNECKLEGQPPAKPLALLTREASCAAQKYT